MTSHCQLATHSNLEIMKRNHEFMSPVDGNQEGQPTPSTSSPAQLPDAETLGLHVLVENDMAHGLQPRNEQITKICRLTSNSFWTCANAANALTCSLSGILQSVEQQLPVLLSWSSQQLFSEYLTTNDKYQLLKSTWADLMVYAAAFRSIATPNQLKLANGHVMDEAEARNGGIADKLQEFHALLVEPFRNAGMHPIEQAIVRAMLFFNPAAQGLENRRQVRRFRDELGEHLYAYSVLKEGESMMRCPNLMSLMDTTSDFAKRCVLSVPTLQTNVEDVLNRKLIDLVQRGVWPLFTNYFSGPPMPQ